MSKTIDKKLEEHVGNLAQELELEVSVRKIKASGFYIVEFSDGCFNEEVTIFDDKFENEGTWGEITSIAQGFKEFLNTRRERGSRKKIRRLHKMQTSSK